MKRDDKIILTVFGFGILVLTLIGLYQLYYDLVIIGTWHGGYQPGVFKALFNHLLKRSDYIIFNLVAIFIYIFTNIVIWGVEEKGEKAC